MATNWLRNILMCPRRPTVFSILQEKVASSSVDPVKRKMAELLEQRLEDSDNGSSGGESEEEASRPARRGGRAPQFLVDEVEEDVVGVGEVVANN